MNPAELFSRDDDPVRLAPGQTLFREGETGDCCMSCSKGRPMCSWARFWSRAQLRARCGAGGFKPANRYVVATMPARLARIDQRRFHFLVQQTPYFATHVMKVLAERLRHMNSMTRNQAVA
jgi:CRP/FNR family cyclic AMP-dependent transcriptional regulator